MTTSFTDWNPNELYHYGTRGMKWGQRRYQNPDGSLTALGRERYGYTDTGTGGKSRSARGMARDLNKLDRERATAQYRYDKLHGRKSKRAQAKAEKYGNLLKRNADMTNRILEKAKASGMTVNTKSVKRVVNKGRTVAKNLAKLGVLAGALYAGSQLAPNNGIAKTIKDWADKGRTYTTAPVGQQGTKVVRNAVKSNGKFYDEIRPYGLTKKIYNSRGAFKDFVANNAGNIAKGAVGAAAVGALATGWKRTSGTKYKVKKNKNRG